MQEKLQEMTKKIIRLSLFCIPTAALVSLFFEEALFAFNIALGGSISLLSFMIIVWAVKKFISAKLAQPMIMGVSLLKILAIGLALTAFMLFGLIKPVPLLGGFTLVLAVIVIQGIITARKFS